MTRRTDRDEHTTNQVRRRPQTPQAFTFENGSRCAHDPTNPGRPRNRLAARNFGSVMKVLRPTGDRAENRSWAAAGDQERVVSTYPAYPVSRASSQSRR
ncbi:hypothetical protein NSI01_29880 [Pimelobacter simplex]|nr:hypothetical protein NSI01_29880 [Pimelobacter simplex]